MINFLTFNNNKNTSFYCTLFLAFTFFVILIIIQNLALSDMPNL